MFLEFMVGRGSRGFDVRRRGSWLCAATLCVMLSGIPAMGQAAAIQATTPLTLHIDILEGDGALNNIRQRDAREPVIQVTDENHKPVSGVAVLFLIHGGSNGAGATFGGQALSLTATTGADGIAHAPGMVLTQTPGSFTVAVTATLGTLVATAVVHQSAVLTAIGTAGASSAAGTASGGTSSAASTAVVHHTIFGLSKVVAITVGTAAVAGVVVGVVAATNNTGTSVTLGTPTVTQARGSRAAR